MISRRRNFYRSLAIMWLMICLWQTYPLPVQAQSGGGFASAMVDLVPASGSTISSALSTGGAGAFFISGNVYLRGTANNCAAISSPDAFVNFGGSRVGTWRMWGFRLDPAQNAPQTNSATGQPLNNISGGRTAVVNMSIDLDSYNGTLQLQGTLGRVFDIIDSTGHSLTDVLAVTGGTGTFRSASGDATLAPVTDASGVNCSSGAFRVTLKEGAKAPRFGNLFQ
jgi:hypothetical protein